MFAVPPIFAVPSALIPFAAWPAMVAASALAAMLFGASALGMVADGISVAPAAVGLKAGVPPVIMRSIPDAEPVAPSVSVLAAKTTVAAIAAPTPEPVPIATTSLKDQSVTTPMVDETASANGFISASRLVVLSDVTVRTDPRSGSRPLGTLHRGERVEVAGKQAGWVLVRQGRSLGWVWGEFLAPA